MRNPVNAKKSGSSAYEPKASSLSLRKIRNSVEGGITTPATKAKQRVNTDRLRNQCARQQNARMIGINRRQCNCESGLLDQRASAAALKRTSRLQKKALRERRGDLDSGCFHKRYHQRKDAPGSYIVNSSTGDGDCAEMRLRQLRSSSIRANTGKAVCSSQHR